MELTKYDSLQSKFQKSKYNTAEAGNETNYEGKKSNKHLHHLFTMGQHFFVLQLSVQ